MRGGVATAPLRATLALASTCAHLVFLSSAFLVVLQDVVPDVVLRVDEQLLGLPLFVAPLHPHHEQQHQDWGGVGGGGGVGERPGVSNRTAIRSNILGLAIVWVILR